MLQGTPKTTPQVQPPVSAMKAADTITPQLAAAAPDLPPAATPEVAVASPAAELAAAADPGHLIGTTDSGGMSAAIEAAHEEAASALARLTYIEVLLYSPASSAWHSIATGPSIAFAPGAGCFFYWCCLSSQCACLCSVALDGFMPSKWVAGTPRIGNWQEY